MNAKPLTSPSSSLKRAALSLAVGALAVVASGCATQSSSPDIYRSSDTQREQTVRMATVESVRKVTIQRDNQGVGTVGGAVVGGLAGSTIGGGRGQDIATVLGAIGGAVAGQAIEQGSNKREGLEIVVKYDDSGETRVIVQEADVDLRPGDRVRVVSGGGRVRVTR